MVPAQAARAREALERAEDLEKALKKQLAEAVASIDGASDAAADFVVQDAVAAAETLAASTAPRLPQLSKMRKADLVAECVERGLDSAGLKVPELRVALRAARAAAKEARPPPDA